jgi:glycosyltransferase involved in cell wall biosynthesis
VAYALDAGPQPEGPEDGGAVSLTVSAARGLDQTLCTLFGRVNGYPTFADVDVRRFRNADRPAVSCVIVLTGNDLFVRNHQIPSIVKHSASLPIEIVVVNNGADETPDLIGGVTTLRSAFGWVARAYNAGAAAARGEYLAIFHDDCILESPRWIEQSLALLSDGYTAVTTELQRRTLSHASGEVLVAKNTPLVMRASDFARVGGYDEFYYAGYEDLDFTYRLLSDGARVGHLAVPYLHFNGMSTVVLLSREATLFRHLFGYNALPAQRILELRARYLRALLSNAEIQVSQAKDLLYFARKHEAFFRRTGRSELLTVGQEADRFLAARASRYLFDPIFLDRQKFIDFYRNLTRSAAGARC